MDALQAEFVGQVAGKSSQGQEKNLALPLESSISRLEMYIPRLEMYIPRLEMCISRLEIELSAGSVRFFSLFRQ